MPYKPRNRPIPSLIETIEAQLRQVNATSIGPGLRDKVQHLVEVQRRFNDLGVSVAHAAGIEAKGGMDRIRLYLIMFEGEVIEGEELQVVSGIAEFARRIRQLRVEQGFQIASGASPDPSTGVDLKPDQYVLVSLTPDLDAARRWHGANRIRKRGGGSQQRALLFLQENVGRVVTTEELAYVAKDKKEYARRVRELRTEQGYSIATKFTGRPDLRMGQYVLQSLERVAEPHDRHLSEDVQKKVYARDQNTCRCCGWNRDKWVQSDPRILELHHIEHHERGGANTDENLVVLCSRCHDDVHAERVNPIWAGAELRFERAI